MILRLSVSPDAFRSWGWRVPFLLSVILLGISIYIRLKLSETPIFAEMKAQGRGSSTPLRDSFLKMPNAKYVWLALLGVAAGQGVVWYTGETPPAPSAGLLVKEYPRAFRSCFAFSRSDPAPETVMGALFPAAAKAGFTAAANW